VCRFGLTATDYAEACAHQYPNQTKLQWADLKEAERAEGSGQELQK